MRVLMTCNTLALPAGSETATYTLAVELAKRGHSITCVSRNIGLVAEKLALQNIRVERTAGAAEKPDVIHAQHHTESLAAHHAWPDVPCVLTTHGLPVGEEEVPEIPLVAHVAVSEEVQDATGAGYIIRNAVDTERFASVMPLQYPPKRALFISHHEHAQTYEVVARACEIRGLTLTRAGLPDPTWDIERLINNVDVVFTLGRGALEAMACGRRVIVYDKGKGDGAVTHETFDKLKERNFSGRTNATIFTAQTLANEIVKSCPFYLSREHSIGFAAAKYERLYREVQRG